MEEALWASYPARLRRLEEPLCAPRNPSCPGLLPAGRGRCDPVLRLRLYDGQLDGHDPVPPRGVLDAARQDPPNAVTWEPRAGVRIASVTVPWNSGTVLGGRSLREVERQEDKVLLIAAAAWLVMLGALAATALVSAWLWSR
jgi:hypothetical protein